MPNAQAAACSPISYPLSSISYLLINPALGEVSFSPRPKQLDLLVVVVHDLVVGVHHVRTGSAAALSLTAAEVGAAHVGAGLAALLLVQLIADGSIKDIDEARRVIAASETLYAFTPTDNDIWNKYYEIYLEKVK